MTCGRRVKLLRRQSLAFARRLPPRKARRFVRGGPFARRVWLAIRRFFGRPATETVKVYADPGRCYRIFKREWKTRRSVPKARRPATPRRLEI